MIVVVLPAFNEEDAIGPLIERIEAVGRKRFIEPVHIVVVDDGSRDRTIEQVRRYDSGLVSLVEHGENRGLGEALKSGLLRALEICDESGIIVTMDADNTHSPGLLMRMVMLIEEGSDLVIASRYQPGSRIMGVSRFRRSLSWCMSLMFRVLFPMHGVRDYSCGFRAYRVSILREAFRRWGPGFLDQPGFTCMVDILLKVNKIGAVLSEVPMILRYDLKKGPSKMNVSRTIRQTLTLALRERLALRR